MEGLGRLGGAQRLPVHRFQDLAGGVELHQRIRDRHDRDDGAVRGEGVNQPVDEDGGEKGTGRVMDHHRVHAGIGERCQSGPDRVGPRGPAGDSPGDKAQLLIHRVEPGGIVRMGDEHNCSEGGMGGERLIAARQNTPSGKLSELFGNSAASALTTAGRDNDGSDLHPKSSSIAATQHNR